MPVEDTPRLQQAVADLALTGNLLATAWSGGKDSTAVLLVALEGYRQAVRAAAGQGRRIAPFYVLTSDTLIENPAVHAYQLRMAGHLAAWARREGVDVRLVRAKPSVWQAWQVKILSGMQLPVYANTKERRCSVDLKREPMKKAMKALLPNLRREFPELAAGLDSPIILVGTRFEESASRNARMRARGDVAGEITRNANGFDTLPLIADWNIEDVWELILESGTDNGKTWPGFAPNFDETFRIYRDAASECVIVDGLKGENRAACGARHGCWACTVSGATDKSMEIMLEHPKYAWMRGLNQVRNYLTAIQYDWGRRRWAPRTRDPVTGFLGFSPDPFHPDECDRLLRMMLTIDRRELERAEALQMDPLSDPYLRDLRSRGEWDADYAERMAYPQFQILDERGIVAIDFNWARYGTHRPFAALKAWRDVHVEKQDYDVPLVEPYAPNPKPPRRWLPAQHEPELYPGAYDAVSHGLSEGCPGSDPHVLADGSLMDPHREDDRAGDIDEEAAWWIVNEESASLIEDYGRPVTPFLPAVAVGYYLRTGAVSLPRGQAGRTQDMVRHAQAMTADGFRPHDTTGYPDGTISEAEHADLRDRMQAMLEEDPEEVVSMDMIM